MSFHFSEHLFKYIHLQRL